MQTSGEKRSTKTTTNTPFVLFLNVVHFNVVKTTKAPSITTPRRQKHCTKYQIRVIKHVSTYLKNSKHVGIFGLCTESGY